VKHVLRLTILYRQRSVAT